MTNWKRCRSEVSTRWPDYTTYTCFLSSKHIGVHESADGKMKWADGMLEWDEEIGDYRMNGVDED